MPYYTTVKCVIKDFQNITNGKQETTLACPIIYSQKSDFKHIDKTKVSYNYSISTAAKQIAVIVCSTGILAATIFWQYQAIFDF